MPATANPFAALDLVALRAELRQARDEALADYVDGGLDVYTGRGALRSDLCLLIAAGDAQGWPTELKLAEVYALEVAGLMDVDTHRLTTAGAEAAAAALIVR